MASCTAVCFVFCLGLLHGIVLGAIEAASVIALPLSLAMPLKTTAIDMHALLDAWEAEREALRARPRPTTHVVDFSCGVEQPVDGGVGARSSVRRSPRTGCVAARVTALVPLAAERGPFSLGPSPTPIRRQ